LHWGSKIGMSTKKKKAKKASPKSPEATILFMLVSP